MGVNILFYFLSKILSNITINYWLNDSNLLHSPARVKPKFGPSLEQIVLLKSLHC